MKKINLNLDWTLQEGQPSSIPGIPQKTRPVHLPHDFTIETNVRQDSKNGANTGFFSGGTYTYTKQMTAPEDWKDQRVLLSFDGVMGAAKVIVNGHVVCVHHYGYTPFSPDISPYLYYGEENRISVTVSNDNEQNSRWYTGSGIYRNVDLLVAPQVHIAPNGIYVYTNHFVGEDAFVIVEASIENHTSKDRCGWVSCTVTEDGSSDPTATGKIRVFLAANSTGNARTQLCVPNAKRWDVDSPNLYQVKAVFTDEDGNTDEAATIFGIRTISVDSRNGFCLNGQPLKLKGGCIHHDNGILGAVSFYDSEYRKVKIHKDNGFNALRTAHNPPSAAFLEACDRLGMLVMDEIFDVWRMQKNYYDFSQYFDLEWRAELEAAVLRDRNHPSIIMWSIGNELPEQGGLSRGYETSAKLAEAVRKLDITRPVCGALCSFFSGLDDKDNAKFWQSLMAEAMASGGMLNNLDGKYGREIWNDRTEAFCAPWDVVGYNYLDYHYEEAGRLFPNRVVCCTESKPGVMESYWADVEKYPYLIGDFAWTSMDYIGEAGIGKTIYCEPQDAPRLAQTLSYAMYPWRTAGCGEFDLCGFPRMQLPLRRIIWGSQETAIAVYDPQNYGKVELLGRYGWPETSHSWTWPAENGVPVKVDVFSSAPEVELILNGKSLGRKPAQNKASFELTYEKGTLEAISWDGDVEISRDILRSAGEIAVIRITPEKSEIPADGQSLCYAAVEFADSEGNAIPYVEIEATAEVSGNADLLAFGSARPATEENYTVGKAISYRGKLLAVIRSGTESGTAILSVKTKDLPEAVCEIKIG